MKYRLIKQKALFQIFLIISLSFYTSFSFAAFSNNSDNKINYFDLVNKDLLQDVDAASKVCCEKTLASSTHKGESCVFTLESDCDKTINSNNLAVACPQTNYCEPGVCKLNGVCSDNVEKRKCINQNGIWTKGKSENDPQCKLGCCDLPSGASITTQSQCADKIKQFPDISLSDTFKPSIQDQPTCLAQSRSSEEGCCVISSQNQCKFVTRKECKDLSGEFQGKNVLCSKPGLNCQVTAKHSTMCYQNKVYWTDSSGNRENIYDGVFDSSWQNTNWLMIDLSNLPLGYSAPKLNPLLLNDIANSGNCQFSLGTTCGEVTKKTKDYLAEAKPGGKGLLINDINKVKYQCINLDCTETKRNDKISWMNGRTRKNGESWCEYQNVVGEGKDLVGSRHFIHRCDNGVEIVEPCLERRKEICTQNDVKKEVIDPSLINNLTYAKCVPNNWQLCLAANADNENCGLSVQEIVVEYAKMYGADYGDNPNYKDLEAEKGVNDSPCGIYLIGGPEQGEDAPDRVANAGKILKRTNAEGLLYEGKVDEFNSCIKKLVCRKKSCEEQALGNCYFNKNVGLCAPAVPIGSLGKEQDYKELTNGNSIGFSLDSKAMLVEKSNGGNPEWKEDCFEGCDSYTSKFADKWNSYCISLADLGAKYNVVGYYSKEGFIHQGPLDFNRDDIDFSEGQGDPEPIAQGVSDKNFNDYLTNIKPLTGNFYNSVNVLNKLIIFNPKLDIGTLATDFLSLNNLLAGVVIFLLLNIIIAATITTTAPIIIIAPAIAKTLATLLAISGPTGPPGWLVAAVVIAIILIMMYIADLIFGIGNQITLTYKFSCQPWVPKDRGEDCKLCNDKSKFPRCDEYLCKSLGKACKLLNDNYPGNETCIWYQQGDTIAPIIAPLMISPFNENDIIKIPASTGYTGGYKFKKNITAFTSIKVGIKIVDNEDPAKEDWAECKISRFNNFKYEDTNSQFFEDTLTKSQHIRTLKVSQSPILPDEDRIELEAGKTNTFYIKCKDANANINIKPYFIEINVNKGPDTAPPDIKSFSIKNNAFIPYNLNKTNLVVYVEDQSGFENSTTKINDPLDGGCKYSTVKGQNYELMPYNLTCSRTTVIEDKFACSTSLDLKPNQENIFYFKCRDLAGNTNPIDAPPVEDDPTDGYHLIGTKELKITQKNPKDEVLLKDELNMKLSLTTSEGAETGKSTCYYAGSEYSLIKNLGDLTFTPGGIKFTTTDSSNHETLYPLLLDTKDHDYLFYVWCRDIAGNEDNATIKFHTTTPNFNITKILPDSRNIYSDKIELQVTTVNGVTGKGEGDCKYNSIGTLYGGTGNINDYKITQNSETTHYKNITGLSDGSYEFEIICQDKGVYKIDKRKINFNLDTKGTPRLIRLFKEGELLNIVTDRRSECHYSATDSRFKFEDGTLMVTNNNLQHSLQVTNSNVYYVKCQDLNTKMISQSYSIYP